MRILQVCTNFLPGGIQRHVLDLAADLRARGHQVTLAGDRGDWADATDPDLVHLPLNRVAHMGGSVAARLAALPGVALALRRLIRERGIEVVHSHETAPAIAVRLAMSLGQRRPHVMTFHGSAPEREPEVARVARTCADLTVSPSQTALDALIGHGLPRSRARQIGLGIAPLPAVPPEDAAALRAELMEGVGAEGVLVLSLSRLARQKGIDVMIDVAARVKARRPDVVFAIAGKGPLREEAEGWARAAGVADRVRFLGAVSTVPLHLAAADLFLLTSRWENLPISIVEAFRAGLPVVATDCGGVRELVDDSVGRLCAVEDAEGLAAAILALVEDADLRRASARAALARSAEPRFDPAAVHQRFEALYQEMLARD